MESLVLVLGSDRLALHGPGASGAVKAALRGAVKPGGGRVVETIDLVLEGTAAEILAASEYICRMAAALCEANRAGVERGLLEVVPAAGCGPYRAVVTGCEAGIAGSAEDVSRGRSGLRLLLEREDGWEGETVDLPLDAGTGALTVPVALSNHADSGHRAHAAVAAADLAGDLPGTAALTLANDLTGGLALGDVWVGVCEGSSPSGPAQVVEGEEASEASSQSAADASNGAFGRFALDAPSAGITAATFSLPNSRLSWWTRGALLPVAKFYHAPTAGDLWLWWQVTAGGACFESGRALLAAGKTLQELPVVTLSPLFTFGGVSTVILELKAKGAGASYTLDLDCIAFFPAENTRRYAALADLTAGGSLQDDGRRVLSFNGSEQAFLSHVRVGEAVHFRPGVDHRVMVLHGGAANAQIHVSMRYTPRYRVR